MPDLLVDFCRRRVAGFKVSERIDAVAGPRQPASGKIRNSRPQEVAP